ncbi:MAG: transcription termination factor NusA [Bacteroidota bacterium]
MNHEFMDALEQIEREKGISKEILLDAIETALASAYKRDQKVAQSIEVRIDSETGAFHVYTHKTVVDEVEDDKNEISLEEAQKINPVYELGDLVEFEIFPKEFGRIAAQTAKQVVMQRIREAERSIIYDEFINRVGDLMTGVVQRFEQRNIFIDLGRIEGILPANEQMPNERYEQGMRIKTYVVEVKKTTKGPQVLLSRTRTGLLKRLFELEVPEIQDGIVELKSVAREPGHRSKIAVYSNDHQIDPVGACVGTRGIRVQMIVRELKGEKIDVIPWSADPIEFIINALSPAKVSDVKILPTKKTAIVIVPDFQLSLAIGKEGQNARLAAKLTGWKIDIKSETQAAEQAEEIERLVYEEIGFRDQAIDTEEEEQTQVEDDILTTEEFPAEDEAQEAEDETEVLPEDHVEPVVHLDDEEEEKVVIKKKNKKSKTISKHLARIELDDEPISLDDGYFFSDVLEKKEGKPNEDDTQKTKKSKKSNEIVNVDSPDEGGFTIGQLFGEELKKVQKAKKKTKGE